MNIVNDLLTKAVEVGVATYLGNTFVSKQVSQQQNQQDESQQKPGFFGLQFGKKTNKKQRTQSGAHSTATATINNGTSSTTTDVNQLVSFVLSIANEIPLIIEKGGPEGRKWVKLVFCVLIDLIGSGSLAVPFLGDTLDLVTAPILAVMLQALFGNSAVTIAGFAEEILPGTDGIPTATLAWLAENTGYLNKGDGQQDHL